MKKNATIIRLACILAAVCLLFSSTALADGIVFGTEGSADNTIVFYVTSKGSSSITLQQTVKGMMLQKSNWDSSERYRNLYGMYHVDYSSTYESGRVEFTDETVQIPFRYSGSYTLTVQPYTMTEMNDYLSTQRSSTDWLYSCVRWTDMPKWKIKSASNCTYQSSGGYIPTVTATPAANKPVLSIYSYNYPTSYTEGSDFSLKGTVYASSGKITKITGEIYNSAGTKVKSTSIYPYTASYSLENSTTFSTYLRFNQLAAGSYTYKLTAAAQDGSATATKELISRSFSVLSAVTPVPETAPVLSVSGSNYPTTMTEGTAFIPKGTVQSSSGYITKITGEILNSYGTAVYTANRYPYKASYDLSTDSTFNNGMKFSSLSAGNYTYRVTATAQNGSKTATTVLINVSFRVNAAATPTPEPAAPVLYASNTNYPTTMTEGNAFTPRGTITSTSGYITKVTGEILNSYGSALYTVNRYPYKTSYDLATDSTFNNGMKFSSLTAGNYTYRVTATAQNGSKTATTVLINVSFRVNAAATPTPEPAAPVLYASNTNYPTTMTEGNAFTPRGTIYSTSGYITKVTGEILNSYGSAVYTVNRYPYKASYDLATDSTYNNGMKFSSLTAGNYTYRVTATAQNGSKTATTVLINVSFRVNAAATPTPVPVVNTPTLSISYASYPTSYAEGTSFYPRGTISTDCGTITKITGEILNSYGSTVYTVNRYPNTQTHTLDYDSTFNNSMKFSRLTPGSYMYKVTATAQNGNKTSTRVLINVSFYVYEAATATPEIVPSLSISGANYPTSYPTGTSLHPKGKITTTAGVITEITGEILNEYGSQVYGITRYPNKASYDLDTDNTYDNAMKFSRLSQGSYTYMITATAKNGSKTVTQVLLQAGFYVYENVTPAPVTKAPVTQPPVTPEPGPGAPILNITGTNEIGTITEGSLVYLTGVITADTGIITAVTAEIYTESGNFVRQVTLTPFTSEVNLANWDDELGMLNFEILPVNTFTLVLAASAENEGRTTTKTLLRQNFRVTKKPDPQGSYTPVIAAEVDTQFRPGTCVDDNENYYKNLYKLTDNDVNTYFEYIFYQSDYNDGRPEFTFTFNNESIGAFGVLNGNLLSESRYINHARPTRYKLVLRDADGNEYYETIQVEDYHTTKWRIFNLSQIYNNIVSVGVFIDEIHIGAEDRYIVHITDIQFYN